MNKKLYDKIKKNWDMVAKPLDSMGVFEDFISRIGAINENERPALSKNVVVVFASDNGIVGEGISQSDQDITAICTRNIVNMQTSVCVMAKANNIDILPVDMGVNYDFEEELTKLRRCKIRKSTRNFLKEPAMTKEELEMAINTGISICGELKEKGYEMIGVGEIGIGNTTTSSAVAASLLKCDAKVVTGRGAGLDDKGLARKIEVIDMAIKQYGLYELEPLEILRIVGGYDIAGMVGIYLGAVKYSIPVVLDGVISMVAALVAYRIDKEVKDYIIPSHLSREPAATKIKEEIGLTPVIDASMALGEGTGAVMMISLLKTANEVYKNSLSFESTGISQYERF